MSERLGATLDRSEADSDPVSRLRSTLVDWGRLFGYDFFISYKRGNAADGGASEYAQTLARELTAADFRVFLDNVEAPIGLELKSTLTRALRRSRALILVATRGAVASKYVQLELETFAGKGRRPVIPINVGNAFSGAGPADGGFGALRAREPIWIDVDEDAVASGRPAAATVDHIRQHAHFVKANVRLRWATGVVMLALVALSAYAGLEAQRATREANNAELRRRQAQAAELAERDARKLADEKTEAAKLALENETKALAHAEQRRIEAQQQRNIAVAGELAARAQILIAQRGTLLPIAGMLAVEASRREPSLDADRAARETLVLLPSKARFIDCARDGDVLAGRFSADGTALATQSKGKPILLWETSTGRSLGQVPLPGARKFVWSPDGKRLVTLDDAGKALVWRVGESASPLTLAERGVNDVAFAASGDYLASVHDDRRTRLWLTNSWTEVGSGWINAEPMTHVAVHPQAEEIAASNADLSEIMSSPGLPAKSFVSNYQVIWTYSADGKHLAQLVAPQFVANLFEVQSRRQLFHEDRRVSLAFSGDGSTIALASPEWDATSYDLRSCRVAGTRYVAAPGGVVAPVAVDGPVGCQRQPTVRHNDSIYRVALSRDGRLMGTVSKDGTARVWETYRGREVLRIVEADETPITELAFVGDGSSIAAWGPKGCRTWGSEGHRQALALAHEDAVVGVAFSPDDSSIATISLNGIARLWGGKSGDLLHSHEIQGFKKGFKMSWRENPRSAPPLQFRPDGRGLLIDGRLVWDFQSGSVDRPPFAEGAVLAVARNWSVVATREAEKIVVLRDRTGRVISRHAFAASVVVAAIAPSGCCIAVAEKERGVSVWQLRDWHRLASFQPSHPVVGFAFDSQGLRLLVRGKRSASIYEATSGRQLQRIDTESELTTADFDPSGRYVVLGDADRNAWLWDTKLSRRAAALHHDDMVMSAAFSHDGRRVVSGGFRSDRTARVWMWRPEDLVKEICTRTHRDLTRSEWSQYLPGEPYRRTCDLTPSGDNKREGKAP